MAIVTISAFETDMTVMTVLAIKTIMAKNIIKVFLVFNQLTNIYKIDEHLHQ